MIKKGDTRDMDHHKKIDPTASGEALFFSISQYDKLKCSSNRFLREATNIISNRFLREATGGAANAKAQW